MEPAAQVLQEKLSKRVLSNKTTREGLLACAIVTLQRYYERKGQRIPEARLRHQVYDQALEAFASIGVDFEFPDLEALQRVKDILASQPPLGAVREEAPDLFAFFEETCATLFQKYEG